jgi:hypothetical protein
VTEPLYAFPAALLAYEFSLFSTFSSLIQDGSSTSKDKMQISGSADTLPFPEL